MPIFKLYDLFGDLVGKMHDLWVWKSTVNNLRTSDTAWRSMEKRILVLDEKAGISNRMNETMDEMNETMDERTIALESAFGVEVQNKGNSTRDDSHNRTCLKKDARVIDGSEKELHPEFQRNMQEVYELFEEAEVIHMEVIK